MKNIHITESAYKCEYRMKLAPQHNLHSLYWRLTVESNIKVHIIDIISVSESKWEWISN